MKRARKSMSASWRRIATLGLVAASIAGSVSLTRAEQAKGEYHIAIGDKLRIAVYGLADLSHTSAVDGSGRVWFPTLGYMDVVGETIDQVRNQVGERLAANGSIRKADVDVAIAEYIPIYIGGTVVKPGAYPFRPGLTVRQAIALAGGISGGAQMREMLYQVYADRDPNLLIVKYRHGQAQMARLEAELGGKEDFTWKPSGTVQLPDTQRRRIYEIEEKRLQARSSAFKEKRQNLEKMIALSRAQQQMLSRQIETLVAEEKRRAAILEKMSDLNKGGVVRRDRIDSFQQDVFSTRYALDSARSQLAGAALRHQELIGNLAKLDATRQQDLLAQISTLNQEMDVLSTQLATGNQRLLRSNSRLRGMCTADPNEGIVVKRRGRTMVVSFDAETPNDVQPGDVIDVNAVPDVIKGLCAGGTSFPN
ncbi:MAG: polysaccharide biosynthesis/export family protein [Hyphomicrobiaceae bacterium]